MTARACCRPRAHGAGTPWRSRQAITLGAGGSAVAAALMPRSTVAGCGTARASRWPRLSSQAQARPSAATVRWSARRSAAARRARIGAGPKSSRSWAASWILEVRGRSRRNSWCVRTPRHSPGARSSIGPADELSRWISRMRGAAGHGSDNWSPRSRRSELGTYSAGVTSACSARARAACQVEASRILAGMCLVPATTITVRLARIRTASRAALSDTWIPRRPRIAAASPARSTSLLAPAIRSWSAARTRSAVLAPREPRNRPCRISRAN